MNHDCHVDIYRLIDEEGQHRTFLRCFKDSTIVEIKDNLTQNCPNCKRPIFITKDIYPQTRKIIQVFNEDFDYWEDLYIIENNQKWKSKVGNDLD